MRPTKYTEAERKIRQQASTYRSVYRLDCSIETAIEMVKAKKEAVKKKRETIAIAVKNGINRKTFSMRIYRGWTPEDALTKPLCRSGRPKKVNDYE